MKVNTLCSLIEWGFAILFVIVVLLMIWYGCSFSIGEPGGFYIKAKIYPLRRFF